MQYPKPQLIPLDPTRERFRQQALATAGVLFALCVPVILIGLPVLACLCLFFWCFLTA